MISIPYNIILGSNSPRRKELLQALDLPFEIRKIEIDETYPKDLPLSEIPLFLSKKKGEQQQIMLQGNELIITADTIVICENEAIGKPDDERNAIEILRKLSGKTHQVVTGVCLTTMEKTISFSNLTEVTFRKLSQEEISYYIQKYKPYDKAGAYGIQEWIGFIGISKISGSYYNVMGLPVDELFEVLKHDFSLVVN